MYLIFIYIDNKSLLKISFVFSDILDPLTCNGENKQSTRYVMWTGVMWHMVMFLSMNFYSSIFIVYICRQNVSTATRAFSIAPLKVFLALFDQMF
jgi:hypothetical protein